MMNRLLATVAVTVMLTGCSVLEKGVAMIPSFWDDNQSAKIVDIRHSIEQITCAPGTQLRDATDLLTELQWFQLYSDSKGSRQKDVLRIIQPMEETVRDWQKRSQAKEGSVAYCTSKRMVLKQQSKRAAESILGRF
jgi:hypothetical protein